MHRSPSRHESFSARVRQEVFDELTVAELVRLADTHHLSVQFSPVEEDATGDGLMGMGIYDPTGLLHQRTVDANDPLWDAFGGFVERHDAEPHRLEDLALLREWRRRREALEREGYFVEAQRLFRERQQRVRRLAESLVLVIEKAIEEADGPQALLVDGWDGSLRSVTTEFEAQLASPAYPDSLSVRVFVVMEARLRELSTVAGATDVDIQTFERLMNVFKHTRKLIERFAYRSFQPPRMPAWHETSPPAGVGHMPSYGALFHSAARGTDPRALLPWLEAPVEWIVADAEDWRIGGLQEVFAQILKESPSSPPLPVSVPARTSDRPPAETLPEIKE